MANAIAGVGTTFERWSGSAWQFIAEINAIEGPTMDKENIEVTALDTDGGYDEFITGFMEGGTLTLSMNFSRSGYEVMKQDFEIDVARDYRITLPDAEDTTLEFEGLVIEIPLTMEAEDRLTADVTIQVTGEVAIASAGVEASEDSISEEEPAPSEDASSGDYMADESSLTRLCYDTFTDTDDVQLSAHTPDEQLGGGWTSSSVNLVISGNKAYLGAYGGAIATATMSVGTLGREHFHMYADLTIPDVAAYWGGLCIRKAGSTNYFRVVVVRSESGTPTVTLSKVVSGTPEVLGTYSDTHEAGTFELAVNVNGNQMTIYWKGVKVLDITTDGSYNTEVNHGIALYRATSATGVYIDNFEMWK